MRALLSCGLVLCLTSSLLAQPPAPKPSPELEKYAKQVVGSWDASITCDLGNSKGSMTYKRDLAGMWLVGSFQGSFQDIKFTGKSLDSYDPQQKKFVSVWLDSMSNTPMVSKGTLEGKKLTTVGMAPGPDGKPTRHRMVTTFKSADAMTFQMFVGPEGKDNLFMTIEYKRKK